jgi:ATP-binding cassette subfamily B protein/ATP-binding cassette subfamily C protein
VKKKYPIIKTFTQIIKVIEKKDKKIFLFFGIYTIVASFLPLLPVYLPKFVINELVQEVINFNNVIKIIIIFTAITAVFSFIEKFTHDICHPRLTMVRIDYLTIVFNKLNGLDYKYCEDPKFLDSNESALDAAGGSDSGVEAIMVKLFTLFAKMITIIIYIIIISQLSLLILLGLLISVFVSLGIALFVKKYRYKLKDKLAHANRKIDYYSTITHDFSYGKDIRLYNFQDKIKKSYDYEIKSYLSVFKKIKNKEYLLAFIDLIFVLISDAVLYYVLITKVLGGMPIADFSMYLVAVVALSTLLKSTSEDFSFVIGEGQYVSDYFNFINKEFNEPSPGLKKVENDTLEIEFKNVSFKYPGTDKWIIKDLDLKINKQEKLAIVGINGAGKTTLVKLITRLFEPTEGQILINGVDIKDYDKYEYMQMYSAVFQDINILAYTIRENITLGLSNDEARIWDCLNRVGLGDKVRSLENGIDHMMLKVIDENGAIFSGGENQKLAIARALYKNGNAIILDEPTAALDALAEADIYQNFNDLVSEKTAIYISHRLASTKFCDHIALFKESKLLEYGTHEELMALQGEYYQMFVVQGKYYQEEEADA